MFIHCELLAAILVLTLDGRVHTGEIIGGQEAVPHSRPYMALVVRHMQNGDTKYCDGFLLDEDFVMTAAHCQAKFYTVMLGLHSYYEQDDIQHVCVKQTFPHEDFNMTYFKNDIMLLKLSSKAKFTKNVKPIALADKNDVPPPKSCLVSGWGRTGTNRISVVLMDVNVTLSDNEQCVKDDMYCCEGEKGTGDGDSGGPLVCGDGKAYGVVSISFRPKADLYYFTKIPNYKSWIDLIMK